MLRGQTADGHSVRPAGPAFHVQRALPELTTGGGDRGRCEGLWPRG